MRHVGWIDSRGSLLAVVSASGLVLSGCTVHVLSPPLHGGDLETAATLGEGRVSLDGSYGRHESQDGLFAASPNARTFAGRLSYGLSDDLDLRFDYQHLRIEGDPRLFVGPVSPTVSSGTFGVKGQLWERSRRAQSMLSMEGSLGGGRSEVGGFVGGDLGLIYAWENPYVIPFVGASFGASIPTTPTALEVDPNALDEDDTVERVKPITSFIVRSTMGAKAVVPLAPRDALGRPDVSLGLLFGMSLAMVWDGERSLPFVGFLVGAELALPSLVTRAPEPQPSQQIEWGPQR